MATQPWADNCLIIAGRVDQRSETRYSPAGSPLSRFVIEHDSERMEAGIPRQVRCRVTVLAYGGALAREAERLVPGAWVRVRGFVARANYRDGAARLVLHAEHIETLA